MKIEIPEPILVIGYDKGIWITVKDFIFYVDGKKFIIPKNFVLDFYSIPKWLHWWRPNYNGLGGEAAAIHDFLRRFYKDFNISIKWGDQVFLEAMRYYGLGTAKIKYIAVRLFVWATDDGGEGRPCKKIIKAMNRREDSWVEYRELVISMNKLG
jgi:hypothetical protein